MNNYNISFLFVLILILGACKPDKEKAIDSFPVVKVPSFNADSAFLFIEKQIKMGPRVPNTKAHALAGDYFTGQFKKYGAEVTEQKFTTTTFDNTQVSLRNIIASFNTSQQKRILLAAHWDTRPFADRDNVNKNAAFDGANDGASGVGVLLEVARVLSIEKPWVGVDIILFDGEDWGELHGTSQDDNLPDDLDSWWCLGSQYWTKNKHAKNYSASYGILLDMVGAARAQFYREGVSMKYAPAIVGKVWDVAEHIGYSDYFVKQNAGPITDDHVFVNQAGKIPMIDIVQYRAGLGYFGDYHHTQKDNLAIINKTTLKAVGETLLHVVFYEGAENY